MLFCKKKQNLVREWSDIEFEIYKDNYDHLGCMEGCNFKMVRRGKGQ